MQGYENAFEALPEFIEGLRIADTHEHLPMEADRPQSNDDPLTR